MQIWMSSNFDLIIHDKESAGTNAPPLSELRTQSSRSSVFFSHSRPVRSSLLMLCFMGFGTTVSASYCIPLKTVDTKRSLWLLANREQMSLKAGSFGKVKVSNFDRISLIGF